MRLITRFKMTAKNGNELHFLLKEVFNELARSEPDMHQLRNATGITGKCSDRNWVEGFFTLSRFRP